MQKGVCQGPAPPQFQKALHPEPWSPTIPESPAPRALVPHNPRIPCSQETWSLAIPDSPAPRALVPRNPRIPCTQESWCPTIPESPVPGPALGEPLGQSHPPGLTSEARKPLSPILRTPPAHHKPHSALDQLGPESLFLHYLPLSTVQCACPLAVQHEL